VRCIERRSEFRNCFINISRCLVHVYVHAVNMPTLTGNSHPQVEAAVPDLLLVTCSGSLQSFCNVEGVRETPGVLMPNCTTSNGL